MNPLLLCRRVTVRLLAILISCAAVLPGQDSEEYLHQRITELQEQLRKAGAEKAIIDDFLNGLPTKLDQLQAAEQQLEDIRVRLATIQRNNLIKLTIRMGMETYDACNQAASFARSSVEAFASMGARGVLAIARSQLEDQAQDLITDPIKESLGLDEESLNSPRTVRIRGIQQQAIQILPELKKVNQALSMSIEAAQAAAVARDGLELGAVGGLLYKNELIRNEFIPAAKSRIAALRAEAISSQSEMQANSEWLNGEIQSLTTALQGFLADLNRVREERRQEKIEAANAAFLASLPPVTPPSLGQPPPPAGPAPVRQPE